MEYMEFLTDFIEQKQGDFIEMSDKIWEYAETRFEEVKSSGLQQEYLTESGFSVRSGLAGEKTAFIAEYGSGRPRISFLGEFDALPLMSQQADHEEQLPLVPGGAGHGCGHNLLGTGALAAAVALKAYAEEEKLPGTIRYYGCPAEENAGGKAYLVRDGYFSDCDIVLTWHPQITNQVVYGSTNANFRVFFTFHGTSAHAANCPELGRSALDAVELMNVGVNYMREHMIRDARVHYAVVDTGGNAPNVVQKQAKVLYAIRAPKITQVKELYDRICNIARGAALMTETRVEIRQVAAYANMVSNRVICRQFEENMQRMGAVSYTKEDYAYAQRFKDAISDLDRELLKDTAVSYFGEELAAQQLAGPIYTAIADHNKHDSLKSSTDVGDVSWNAPTAYITAATWAAGTAVHSWQAVAQGKSGIAHKGMLYAAKVMAVTGCDFLLNPGLVQEAKNDFEEMLGDERYPNPLPKDCKPEKW